MEVIVSLEHKTKISNQILVHKTKVQWEHCVFWCHTGHLPISMKTNYNLSKVLLEAIPLLIPQHMRKMTWRSGSCLVQLPPSSSKCVVYQVKNTIIVSFKSHMVPDLFPHTDNCTLKVEDKRKTLLVSMVMSYSKCSRCVDLEATIQM